jgi:hypothetical protein
MELVQLYRNNGCIYGTDYQGSNNSPPPNKRIIDVGYVEILYAYELFAGTFESFTITEDASKPFTLQYSFVFNCSQIVSINDMISASSDFTQQSTGLTLVPGQQLSNTQLLNNQNQLFTASQAPDQAINYNILNNQGTLNQANVNQNQGNSTPLLNLNN